MPSPRYWRPHSPTHSSKKELLPPGRGPAGVAQQCPVPAKRLAFRMVPPRSAARRRHRAQWKYLQYPKIVSKWPQPLRQSKKKFDSFVHSFIRPALIISKTRLFLTLNLSLLPISVVACTCQSGLNFLIVPFFASSFEQKIWTWRGGDFELIF